MADDVEGPSGAVHVARGARGAVVAPHHLATAAGLAMLEAGGHAVDAAIATNAVLAVVVPNHCGLGGDAFWLVWDEAEGEQTGLNGSGRAPGGASIAALRARGLERIPLRGPFSITTPGAVRSWADAHRRWGRLPRSTLLAPAIGLAADGFPALDGLVRAAERITAETSGEPWAAGLQAVWRPGGRPIDIGDTIRLPALATTLTTLADEGFDTAYDGDLGARIGRALVTAGAPFSIADLRDHRSTWTVPIATTYRGVRATTHPPNSSGLLALELLKVLERFEPPPGLRFGPHGWTDAVWPHLILEAAKRVYADRDAHLSDPDRRVVPVGRLLSVAHAQTLAERIDPRTADPSPHPVRMLVGGTVYVAAVDGDGNAASLIQSIAAGFGSGILDPGTGIHFQNRGASFSLDPGHPNAIEPGRRTAHTLLPGMVFRGGERRPWLIAGSMGGDIQPQLQAGLVSALLDGGADVATAIAAPRVAVKPAGWLAPPVDVVHDGALGQGVESGLARRGHSLRRASFDGALGHQHAIELVDGGPAGGGSLVAVTDPRSPGRPAVR